MALGTLLALFPGRRRRGTEAVSALVGDPTEVTSKSSLAPERDSDSDLQHDSGDSEKVDSYDEELEQSTVVSSGG